MDFKSLLGYSQGSPYRGNKSIVINTPQGLIDMSNTDIPLMAMDETGMSKILMPFSGMHKFRGKKVKETPIEKKGGLTPEKAHEMLQDGTAHGKPLTPAQKRYFGLIYGKSKLQMGGISIQDAIDFLYSDDEKPKVKEETTPTAPSDEELNTVAGEQNAEDVDYNLAMSIANRDFFNAGTSSVYGKKETKPTPINKGVATQIDPNVVEATNELLSKFPNLKITSTIRNWGDKDAHPVGRAIDVAGSDTDSAWQYYKDVIVPKYKFNPALNPNHGTGKHIHVGYYQKGGHFRPKF